MLKNYVKTNFLSCSSEFRATAFSSFSKIGCFALLVFFTFLIFSARSQQPAFFVLGENELKGVQIYDVIQDHHKNYWIASNEGIFRYNYSSFDRISCPEARSNSAFNFVMDSKGRIYCHNLNNQVFRITNGTCKLFYELLEAEGQGDVSLAIADDGNLLISSRKIIVIDENGSVKKRYEFPKNYIGQPFTRADKKVSYHLSNSDKLLTYSKGTFFTSHLSDRSEIFRFLQSGNSVFAIDLISKNVFRLDNNFTKLVPQISDSALKRSQSLRVYETSTGLWMAGTLPGVVHFNGSMLDNSAKILYEDYFISDVFVDQEGNTLLSTFDKGILVVPDLKVNDVIGNFKEDPATSLLMDNGQLIIGTSKGLLLQHANGEFIILNREGKRPIEVVAANKDLLIFDDGHIRALIKKSGKLEDVKLASLKSVCYLGDNSFLLGTNRGVILVKYTNGVTKTKTIDALHSRVHRMTYDSQRGLAYISTSDGLYTYHKDGVVKQLKYKGKDLYPNDMHYENQRVYLVLREEGILIVKGRAFEQKIIPKVNGVKVQLKKIRFYKNTMIGSTITGLYQFDTNGKMMRPLHQLAGFASKRVIDFLISKNNIWVSHSGGVQKVELGRIDQSPRNIALRFEQIRAKGKNLLNSKNTILNADERKIHFSFISPSLRNRESVRYHYRLIGADTNWTINAFDENYVTYSALSPGNYVFQVKCEQQGKFSELLTFSFEIKKPFYLTWWFFSLSVLFFLFLVVLFYRRKLRQQNKKAELINELHASKLTAIQSQMNPHFIFNSLNSIQDLILKGDVENSYSYITTFSNLVRRTLTYSEKDFIDFEKEIKLLELYLSLEKLRFKKDFHYQLNYEGVEDVMIPPLLVQPFIENALVHGLLHREGEKRLQITFRMEEHLICTIEDNGIGRQASKEIKERQRLDHESFSSEAIRKRFDILSKVFEGEFGFEYEDLYEKGLPSGTKVSMKIPVKHKF